MKDMICIICPKGCRLHVDTENGCKVTGHSCPRGEVYGKEEALHPTRVITSTVRVKGASLRRCPVKLDRPIPKEYIFQAMKLLEGVSLEAPVAAGQKVVEGVCGTEANFVTTRNL